MQQPQKPSGKKKRNSSYGTTKLKQIDPFSKTKLEHKNQNTTANVA